MSVVAAEDTTDINVSSDANTTLTTDDSIILEETESNEATQNSVEEVETTQFSVESNEVTQDNVKEAETTQDSVVDEKDGVSTATVTYSVSSYAQLVTTINNISEWYF